MIPSPTWFPSSLADRAAWFQNFFDKFSALATVLGFLPTDVAALADDNLCVQWLAKTAVDADAFGKSMTAFRKEIFEGPLSNPLPTIPTLPDLATPHIAFPGLFERLDDLVKRIRVAAKYSDEEGQELGIVPKSGPGKSSLDNDRPTLKVRALPSNVVEVTFVRGVSNGIDLEMKLDNEIEWKAAGMYIKSPGDFVVPANTGNLPRSVSLRARFLDGNKPIGLVSDVVNVVTTP